MEYGCFRNVPDGTGTPLPDNQKDNMQKYVRPRQAKYGRPIQLLSFSG